MCAVRATRRRGTGAVAARSLRAWKACSISSSIVLSASPSCATSPRSPTGATRCVRSPAAMVRATPAMCSSGRNPRRSTSQDPIASTASNPAAEKPSIETRWRNDVCTSVSGIASTTLLPFCSRRRDEDPPLRRARHRTRREQTRLPGADAQRAHELRLLRGVGVLDAGDERAAAVTQLGVGLRGDDHRWATAIVGGRRRRAGRRTCGRLGTRAGLVDQRGRDRGARRAVDRRDGRTAGASTASRW